jgi:hypothetical protein
MNFKLRTPVRNGLKPFPTELPTLNRGRDEFTHEEFLR